MTIKLIKPSTAYQDQVMAYKDEFLENNEDLAGTSYLRNYDDYEAWCGFVEDNEHEQTKHSEVTASVYLAIRESDDCLIGFTNIRHGLNDYLFNYGGHIGYSVKIDQRKKGYAREIMRLTLEKCQDIGLNKVLVTCNINNHASAKIIEKHGGILENIVLEGNEEVKRYWIDLKE